MSGSLKIKSVTKQRLNSRHAVQRDGIGHRRPASRPQPSRLQLNRHTRGMSLSVPIEMQPLAEGRFRHVRRRRGAREGLSPLSARGVGQAQAPAAAQPSRKSQPSSPDANPVQEVAGTVVRHGWVPLGPTERPPGARQTCFWALFQRSRANHSYNEPVVQ